MCNITFEKKCPSNCSDFISVSAEEAEYFQQKKQFVLIREDKAYVPNCVWVHFTEVCPICGGRKIPSEIEGFYKNDGIIIMACNKCSDYQKRLESNTLVYQL